MLDFTIWESHPLYDENKDGLASIFIPFTPLSWRTTWYPSFWYPSFHTDRANKFKNKIIEVDSLKSEITFFKDQIDILKAEYKEEIEELKLVRILLLFSKIKPLYSNILNFILILCKHTKLYIL